MKLIDLCSDTGEVREGTIRAFKRIGNEIRTCFRCTSGPRKGQLVANPATCYKRPDFGLARKLRTAANRTKNIRKVKAKIGRRKAVHFRLMRLNHTNSQGK